jgi:hypothetical protein
MLLPLARSIPQTPPMQKEPKQAHMISRNSNLGAFFASKKPGFAGVPSRQI